MKVTLVLLGGLEEIIGRKRVDLELEDGARVKDALQSLATDEVEYGSVIVNSQRAHEGERLSEGDILYVFRPFAGG